MASNFQQAPFGANGFKRGTNVFTKFRIFLSMFFFQGMCSCRTGVMGVQCSNIKPGYFFPNFTYIKYEPEFANSNGTFSWYYLVRDYAKYFTGRLSIFSSK